MVCALVEALPDVTNQAHSPTLGLQVRDPSQLGNNHTMQAAVEVPHHGKSTDVKAEDIASLLSITQQ